MTVLTQNVRDVEGATDNGRWYFSAPLREGSDGHSIVTSREVSVKPVDGLLTVDLDPGPASVRFSGGTYTFTVPDADTELWPLIQASIGVPPATPDQRLADAVGAYFQAHPPITAVDGGGGTISIG